MAMNESQYMEARLQDQIDWYGRKSVTACRWFKGLRTLELAAAAAIPFIAGYTSTYPQLTAATGALGVLIAVIAGLLSLNQFQERWVEYRTTCEELKREKFLYLTRSTLYAGENALALLAQRVEELLAKEQSNWSQYMRSTNKSAHKAKDEASDVVNGGTVVPAATAELTPRIPSGSEADIDIPADATSHTPLGWQTAGGR